MLHVGSPYCFALLQRFSKPGGSSVLLCLKSLVGHCEKHYLSKSNAVPHRYLNEEVFLRGLLIWQTLVKLNGEEKTEHHCSAQSVAMNINIVSNYEMNQFSWEKQEHVFLILQSLDTKLALKFYIV